MWVDAPGRALAGRTNALTEFCTVTRTPMISTITDNSTVEAEMSARHPLHRLGEPDEIADAAVFLASEFSRGMTGVNMSVDGGLHASLGL